MAVARGAAAAGAHACTGAVHAPHAAAAACAGTAHGPRAATAVRAGTASHTDRVTKSTSSGRQREHCMHGAGMT